MTVRLMQAKDNQPVKELIQTSLEEAGLAVPGTAYFDPYLGSLYEYYEQNENANYWVIEQNDKIIGGVGIAPFNREEAICELQKIYVASACRGKGLSRLLMDSALDFAAKHYRHCYLETHTSLEAACRLYEKYGFVLLEKPLQGSEHSAMDAWYLKKLSS